MRIASSVFSIVSRLIGGNAEARPARGAFHPDGLGEEEASTKTMPLPNQKISVCTSYVYEGTRVACWGDEISADCEDVPDQKEGEFCSQPKDSYEEATHSLGEQILGQGKVLKDFQERPGTRTAKVCADLAWERKGRLVTTGGNAVSSAGGREIPEETLPLIYREKKEICGEAGTLEAANKKWEAAAAQYAKSYPYYQYRDPRFQKIADDERNKERPIPFGARGRDL